jgi:riboflavin transporter FmnP
MLNFLVLSIAALTVGAFLFQESPGRYVSIKAGAAGTALGLLVVVVWNYFFTPLTYGAVDLLLVRRFSAGSLAFYVSYVLFFCGVGGVVGSIASRKAK